MAENIKFKDKIISKLKELKNIKFNRKLFLFIFFVGLSCVLWFLNKTASYLQTNIYFKSNFYNFEKFGNVIPNVSTNFLKVKVQARGGRLIQYSWNKERVDFSFNLSKYDLTQLQNLDSSVFCIASEQLKEQIELQLPSEMKFLSVEPDTIYFDFSSVVKKKVAINLDVDLNFSKQYQMSKLPIIEPDSIEISGKKNLIDSIKSISTKHIKLSNINKDRVDYLPLDIPKNVHANIASSKLSLFVDKYTEGNFDIYVTCINLPDSLSIRIFPKNVNVSFKVCHSNYKKVGREMFNLVVDYNDILSQSKLTKLPVMLTRYPKFLVNDIMIKPQGVEFLIEKKSNQN